MLIIGVIYRPPNQDISSFNDEMSNIVNVVRIENKTCYLLIIGVIYRPPNQDISSFNDKMSNIVNVVRMENKTCYLLIIGVIYRPPNQDISSFNEKMSNIVNVVRMENKTCYLHGDYNINILNYESHAETAQFVDMMSSNGFFATYYSSFKSDCNISHAD